MNARVLIVEDDDLSSKLMRDVLQAKGFETWVVTDGADALSAAIEFDVGLVVMDVGLPNIDGAAATRLLRADPQTREIPVLAVSAYAMPDDEKRMREAGCDAFLKKPLKFQDFVRMAKELMAV
jgi:two-component system cell cycle response regulator DivK